MRSLVFQTLMMPLVAFAHPGHGEANAFHWHGAELWLGVLALAALAAYLLRR